MGFLVNSRNNYGVDYFNKTTKGSKNNIAQQRNAKKLEEERESEYKRICEKIREKGKEYEQHFGLG